MTKTIRFVSTSIAFIAAVLIAVPAWAGGGMNCGFGSFEGASNTVRLFPTYAVVAPDDKSLIVPVHVWVHEREQDRLRDLAVRAFAKTLDIEKGSPEYEIFQRRMVDFMVDNESGEEVHVRVQGKGIETLDQSIGETPGHGHIFATVKVPLGSSNVSHVNLSVRVKRDPAGSRTIRVPVIPASGITVVSDIDDTIKITNVLDKRELLANTFTREFRAVPGMADLFAGWEKKGAAFHYLSASPWNLQADLGKFAHDNGFPSGVYHLRMLRLKDVQDTKAFFEGSEIHKLSALETLIRRFPKRRFILVGDTGERDPEIYGKIARRFPGRIEHIYLRKVEGADHSEKRFQSAFEGVDARLWTVFDSSSL